MVLTDGDVVLTDGQNVRSIADSRIKRFLFDQISSDNFDKSYVVYNRPQSEVWICVPGPSADSPNAVGVWDVTRDKWGFRFVDGKVVNEASHIAAGNLIGATQALDWDSDADAWDSDITIWNEQLFNAVDDGLLQADETGARLIAVDAADIDSDGDPIPGYVTRGEMDFGEPETVKLVKSVFPRITGQAGTDIVVRVGGQFHRDEPVNYSPPQNYTIGTSDKIDVLILGRLLSFQFSTVDVVPRWQLQGFSVELGRAGQF